MMNINILFVVNLLEVAVLSMQKSETINILKKVCIWDLILFVPGALLFSYLPLNNLLDMFINVVIFIVFYNWCFLYCNINKKTYQKVNFS